MKKQTAVALVLLLLIPVLFRLQGMLSSLINPESAAGHPNYSQNFQRLSLLKHAIFWASLAAVAVLWLLVCHLVIRSKKRSPEWLLLAAFGPFGFAVLAMLNDREPGETDWYARFVRKLNRFVRAGYELGLFFIIWELAEDAMVLKRNLMIRHEAATTGVSIAQIIAVRDASSGMWAFGEGMEVMYLVVLFYLLWPVVFNIVGRVAASMASPKAR